MKEYLNIFRDLSKRFGWGRKTKEMSQEKKDAATLDMPHNSFISDCPLVEFAKDEFKRWPFAQKLAQVILAHSGSDSLVIGINGKWGEGKTTVLRFIETEIKKDTGVICIWFNPWLFKDDNQLLLHFFVLLSGALKKSLKTNKEIVGKILKYAGTVIPPIKVSMPDGTGTEVDFGQSLERIGDSFSSTDITDLKCRLEEVLKHEKKRIVILMDDIDRLDKSEIQGIFKLIKLIADFPYTNYILAFDKEMVSKAIGEQYGGGSEEGHSFLEKIIQVSLDLPKLDQLSLRQYCFNIIYEVTKVSKVELIDDEAREYTRCFAKFLEVMLKTPRMAKRYGNILSFVLPMIGREVNLVDLMLIEGVRIFYPDLYALIRTKPDIFFGTYFDSDMRNKEAKAKILKHIDKSINNLDENEKDAAKDLIKYLFPIIEWVFGGATYNGLQWEDKWAENKRIASRAYYRRYFIYSVPEDDISDTEMEEFLEKIKNLNLDAVAAEIKKLIGNNRAEVFISKLKKYEKGLSTDLAKKLSLAISKSGDIFHEPDILFSFLGPFSQAAILISRLVKQVPKSEGRLDLAKEIVDKGEPISFVSECFLWMRASKEHEENRIFTKEEEDCLGGIIVKRIEILSQKETIFISFPQATPRLLSIWSDWGDKTKLLKYLTEVINADPKNAVLLIKTFLSRGYSMETGVRLKSDFERNGYDAIKRIIDPELLLNGLTKLFGKLDDEAYPYLGDTKGDNDDKVLAQQFAFIHNKVKSENRGNGATE